MWHWMCHKIKKREVRGGRSLSNAVEGLCHCIVYIASLWKMISSKLCFNLTRFLHHLHHPIMFSEEYFLHSSPSLHLAFGLCRSHLLTSSFFMLWKNSFEFYSFLFIS
jgi:hypothetical protein